jgi:hypothetical protein|tara:strand:+ start:82 stop:1338 length:1257 start_codon:yes stop_codon:yes gene_type:complete
MLSKKNYILYISGLILYFSLIFGYSINEDLNGGAKPDFYSYVDTANLFANDFLNTFLNYDERNDRHSPIISIIISQLFNFGLGESIIRFIGLNVCLLNIVFFYKCLRIKFRLIDPFYLKLLSLVIFLSPTFRALSIWPDSRIYGLMFFLLSLFYFLRFKLERKSFNYVVFNAFYLAVSSYFSPNFGVFSIFFFIYFLFYYKFTKKLFLYIVINLLLAYPAFHYLFILDVFFLNSSTTPASQFSNDEFFSLTNFSNKIMIILSIIFFYYLPFFFQKKIKSIFKIEKNFYFITAIILLIITNIVFFNYKVIYTGGGIFFKTSNYFFNNNYLFYLIAFFSYFIFFIRFSNYNNLLIIILLIISNPQLTIYHKYYDPFLFFLFFTIFDLKIKREYFSIKSISLWYLFYLFFISVSIYKLNYI